MKPQDRFETIAIASTPPSRKSLPPFEALRAFDAVARLGGVRKAAQCLARDHAVISRHLRAIEAWTGATLIERTAAGVVLTADGARYHRQIAAAMDLVARATLDLMRRGDYRRLHIQSISGFAAHWLSKRLAEFEKNYPKVDLELKPTDRLPDGPPNEADVYIQFIAAYQAVSESPVELRSVDLISVPIVAVASQAYLAAAPPIKSPADLLRHKLLHEESYVRWGNWLAAHGIDEDLDLTGPLLWQGHLTLQAAHHGRGIALTNHLIAAEDLALGRLVEVGKGNPAFQPLTLGTYRLVARADRWDAPLVRRFREWLRTALAEDASRLLAIAAK